MTNLSELVPMLLEKTEAGKVKWEEGGGPTYVASFNDFVFRIQPERAGSSYYALNLLDPLGNLIEQTKASDFDADANTLARLYDLARRQALKVEERLSAAKAVLSKL